MNFMPFGFMKAADGGGTRLWIPTDLSGLTSWYDASDATTITTGAVGVTRWDDKSPAADYLEQTGGTALQPLYSATLNGMNVVGLTTSTKHLTSNAGATGNTGAKTGLDSSHCVLYRCNNAASSARRVLDGGGATWIVGPFNGFHRAYNGAFTSGVFLTASNLTVINAFTKNTSNLGKTYIDGEAKGQNTASQFPTYYNVGTPSQSGIADVAEIVTWDESDDTSRQLVEGYLAWRWGEEGLLPVGHPYKLAAPTI